MTDHMIRLDLDLEDAVILETAVAGIQKHTSTLARYYGIDPHNLEQAIAEAIELAYRIREAQAAEPMPAASGLVVAQTANVTLGNVETGLTPDKAPNGIPVPFAGAAKSGYIALVIVTIAGVINVDPSEVITVNVHSGTDPTGPVIGAAAWKNPTNQPDSVGAGSLVVPVPVGTQNVFIGALGSTAKVTTAVATPTEPITVTILALTVPN